MVIFGNLLILVNLVISVIFSDYCESDGSGDSGTYGHSCDSGDCIESAHSCEYGASGDFDKNGYSVDSAGSGDSNQIDLQVSRVALCMSKVKVL